MSNSTSTNYDFGEELQRLIVGFMMRDVVFMNMTDGLIKPEYFDRDVHGFLANIISQHWEHYCTLPSLQIIVDLVKKEHAAKKIDDEMKKDISVELGKLWALTLSNRDYMVDKVVEFARYQAMTAAIFEAADQLDNGGSINDIVPKIQKAADVGSNDDSSEYDYRNLIEHRKHFREQEAAGTIKRDGITTGHHDFDRLLYHRGWGRRELTLYMGGPKSGKSIALGHHARKAVEAGKNVLLIPLEVSAKIFADRIDAGAAHVPMDQLMTEATKVSAAAEKMFSNGGILKIHEFASGTFGVADLRRLIKRYQNKGIYFDLVVVDYVDLMRSASNSSDPIERSKILYIDLRALAFNENLAILSATQTNRDGAKSQLAKDTDVAEDFNKVRTVDLLISINADETEKAAGTCRLFLAASRNQASAVLDVKRDIAAMVHIHKILKVTGL